MRCPLCKYHSQHGVHISQKGLGCSIVNILCPVNIFNLMSEGILTKHALSENDRLTQLSCVPQTRTLIDPRSDNLPSYDLIPLLKS